MWFKRVKINSLKLYALKACPYEKKIKMKAPALEKDYPHKCT